MLLELRGNILIMIEISRDCSEIECYILLNASNYLINLDPPEFSLLTINICVVLS